MLQIFLKVCCGFFRLVTDGNGELVNSFLRSLIQTGCYYVSPNWQWHVFNTHWDCVHEHQRQFAHMWYLSMHVRCGRTQPKISDMLTQRLPVELHCKSVDEYHGSSAIGNCAKVVDSLTILWFMSCCLLLVWIASVAFTTNENPALTPSFRYPLISIECQRFRFSRVASAWRTCT